jgi:hypothetical protein
VYIRRKGKLAMTNPPIKKPLLETFVDILNISLDILNNIPNTGEDNDIVLAKQGIEEVKKGIDDYIKRKGDELTYPEIPPEKFD